MGVKRGKKKASAKDGEGAGRGPSRIILNEVLFKKHFVF